MKKTNKLHQLGLISAAVGAAVQWPNDYEPCRSIFRKSDEELIALAKAKRARKAAARAALKSISRLNG